MEKYGTGPVEGGIARPGRLLTALKTGLWSSNGDVMLSEFPQEELVG